MKTLVAAAEPPDRSPAPFAGQSMSVTAASTAVAIDPVGLDFWPIPDDLLRPGGGTWSVSPNPGSWILQ